jgi:hypothetical protein
MQRLGLILMWLGVFMGALVAFGLAATGIAHVELHGLAWWIALGAVKLTLLGSTGLLAGGAALRRLGTRRDERLRLEHDARETPRLGD